MCSSAPSVQLYARSFMLTSTILFTLCTACGDPPLGGPLKPGSATSPRSLNTCAEVVPRLRAAVRREMTERLLASHAGLTGSGECSGGTCGTPQTSGGGGCGCGGGSVLINNTDGGDTYQQSGSGPLQGNTEQASTNSQEQGVDEPDLVKTDGTYLYVVADGALQIIQAWPPDQAKALARVPLKGTPHRLYVSGDRALVYSSVGDGTSSSETGTATRPCTYGYACKFVGDGNPTSITVFDLTQRHSPRVVRQLSLSGSYLSSRRVGRAVYTVISSASPAAEALAYRPEPLGPALVGDRPALAAAYDRLWQQNKQKIDQMTRAELLPRYTETIHLADGSKRSVNLMWGCRGFFDTGEQEGDQLTSIISLELTGERPSNVTTMISRPGAVYASVDALYLAVERQYLPTTGQTSTIHKLTLQQSPPSARYAATGAVKGRVLNQFAMSERSGHLRVATTTGRSPSPMAHSSLTVLAQAGGLLRSVGLLDGLAPGEDIRAVRFEGDRGYIVTFKRTDPLFVLDLARPADPRLLAELKVPGFSTYIHAIDPDHLLTVGYDTTNGSSQVTGMRLQLFDVSSSHAPKLAHVATIGTRGSSSEALTNHLAFTYLAQQGLLALPMTVCESTGSFYSTQMTFSGLMVYDVTPSTGFKLRGKVAHTPSTKITCNNWWTDGTSQVRRSIVLGQHVFSISDVLIKVNHLDALATDVVQIPLGS